VSRLVEPATPPHDLAIVDLRLIVELGLERGGELLDAAELAVCAALATVDGPEGRLIARLSARVGDAHRVDGLASAATPDPEAACDALVAAGLLDEGASWEARIAGSPMPRLAQWCEERGLPRAGGRAALVARLLAIAPAPLDGRWVTWPHRRLILRLERFATLRKEPDRGLLVAERLGHVAWPEYTPTGGPVLFADRRALLAWEHLYDELAAGALPLDRALAALRDGTGTAPGGLSLARRLRRAVREVAEGLARAGRHRDAAFVYAALERAAALPPDQLAAPLARVVELGGDPVGALALLQARRSDARPDRAIAIERAGRRLGRSLRRSFVPGPPLREPRRRAVAVARVDGAGPRPRWRVAGRDLLVEDAVVALVQASGRRALRCEGPLVRALFSVVFVDAVLAPLPGALPVPRLPGPLDLGTPDFAARRPAWIQPALDAVAAGAAPSLVRAGCARLAGVRLAGLELPVDDPEPLVAFADALGPAGVRALLVPLLRDGPRVAAGLPDLFLLPGPEVRIDAALPARLPEGPLFVEVKGPGDALRDAQRAWIDRLLAAELSVEVWDVTPPRGR
jgi:hypothetical protein